MTTVNFGLIVTQDVTDAIVNDIVEFPEIHAYNSKGVDCCTKLAGACPLVASAKFTLKGGPDSEGKSRTYQLGTDPANDGNASLTAGSNGELTVGSG